MNDLMLTSLHDLVIEEGDLKLLNRESLVAAQALKIALLTLRGEWWLDTTIGVPYLQEILKKGIDKRTVDTIFINEINQSYRIEEVINFTSEVSNDNNYSVNFQAETTDGEIISITNLKLI